MTADLQKLIEEEKNKPSRKVGESFVIVLDGKSIRLNRIQAKELIVQLETWVHQPICCGE